MNAAEHYAEAERLLQLANDVADRRGVTPVTQLVPIQAAQVHATLALAASQMRSLTAEQDTRRDHP